MSTETDQRALRRQEIRRILARDTVTDQQTLVEALRAAGFDVTQSSVSRDLQEMGVAKARGRYVAPAEEATDGGEAGLEAVARFLRTYKTAGPNLTVIHTLPGTAQTVAAALDGAGWPEVVGTVAGDDTLFVATASIVDQKRLTGRLSNIIRG